MFFITRSYNTERDLVLTNMQTTSLLFSTSLRNILQANKTDMAVTFEGPTLQRTLAGPDGLKGLDKETTQYLVEVFKARVRASKPVMAVSLMNRDGFVIASSREDNIGSKTPLPGNSFMEAQKKRDYHLTDTFYIPGLTNIPIYSMILPIFKGEEFQGALAFAFSADFIQGMIDRSEFSKKQITRLITIVDRNNRIVSTNNPDFQRGESISNYLEGVVPNKDLKDSVLKNEMSLRTDLVRFKTISANNIGYFSRLEENGWGVLLSIDENEILGPLRRILMWNVLFAVAVIMAVSLIFTRLTSYFSGPVIRLTETMDRYRSGDESARFEYSGDDEFGHIAVAFNEMAETLNIVLANEKNKSRYYKDKSNIDQLSGILNKAATETLISNILKDSAGSASHALLIMDIDNFKSINDNFGHASGDRVIKEVAAELKKTFRNMDIVGRIGGDEFMVFIRYVGDIAVIREKAENIAEAAARSSCTVEGLREITMSIGCSRYPADGTTFRELYEKADKALYKTKKNGKNGLTIYEA